MNVSFRTLLVVSLLFLPQSLTAVPAQYTSYGTRDSGFLVLASGGTLNASSGVTQIVNKGKLELDSITQLGKATRLIDSIFRLTASSGRCEARMSGSVATSGAITLDTAGDRVLLIGGRTPSGVTVSIDSEIGGSGLFGGSITIGANKTLTLALDSVLNQNITSTVSSSLSTAALTLNSDLVLASGVGITVGTISCNNNKLIIGDTDISFSSCKTTFYNAAVVMNANVTLTKTWALATDGSFEGGGNTLNLGTNGVLDLASDYKLSVSGLKLSGLDVSGKIINANMGIYATDSVFSSSAGTFSVIGESRIIPTSVGGDFFGSNTTGTLTFATASELSVEKDITLGSALTTGTWAFAADTYLSGKGRVLNLATGVLSVASAKTLYLSDIILADLTSASLSMTGSGQLRCSNVSLFDDGGSVMRILGSANPDSATQTWATVVPTTGQTLFSGAVTWSNGVVIDLEKGISPASRWTFSNTSHINGGGNTIDFNSSAGIFSIAAGKTLVISNAIIKNLKAGSFAFGGADSILKLQNCVVTLGGSDVTLGGATPTYVQIQTEGVNTIVTGDNILTFTANASLTVNAGSVCYYDTEGASDKLNITTATIGEVSGSISGRVVALTERESRNIAISGSTYSLSDSLFLYPDSGAMNGVQITCSGTSTIDGKGRSLILPDTSLISDHTVLTISSGTTTTRNITLDGLESAHISNSGTLIFGNGTTIKLGHDDALTQNYQFGSANSSVCVLDLCGYDLDLASSALVLKNDSYTGLVLKIKNGRLLNCASARFSTPGSTNACTIILQDVDMVLSGALSTALINWEFMGNCRVSAAGTSYQTWTQASTASGCFKIDSGARLTVTNGMTVNFAPASGGTTAIALVDRTSVLELIGGTLQSSLPSSGYLIVKAGNLVADHASTLSGNITLGDPDNPLYIDLFPGAQVNVAGGTVRYANVDSAS